MYTPPHFKNEHIETLHHLIRENSFATLIINNEISHVPLLLKEVGGNMYLTGHLAKANPQWKLFDGTNPAIAIFHGPHAYISPTWYGTGKSVPTWNYAVVHVHGKPCISKGSDAARDIVTEMSDYFEKGFSEPWSVDKVPADFMESKLKGIIAFEIPIDRLEGKFKLGQNHSAPGVINGLKETGNFESLRIADMMANSETKIEQ